MSALNVRIPNGQYQRWLAYTRAAGMTMTALVKAAVDEHITSGAPGADAMEVVGIDNTKIAVAHGDRLVIVVSSARGGPPAIWAGDPAATRALAAMLLHQAVAAETDGRTSP